jgi:hypothetical protein
LLDEDDSKLATRLRRVLATDRADATYPITVAISRTTAWPDEQTVRATFTLTNRPSAATSGFVTASVWQDVHKLLSGRWFQFGGAVENLAVGASTTQVIELTMWSAGSPIPGDADVRLDYWVEDPAGSLAIVRQAI